METVRIQGSTRLTIKNKTQRLRWNISVQPIKNNTSRVKVNAVVDNKKIIMDAVFTPRGKKMDIEGYKILNGNKTPVSYKNVDLKKLSKGIA